MSTKESSMCRIEKDTIEAVVRLLNIALGAEGDVFGVAYNEATDVVSCLECILEEELK